MKAPRVLKKGLLERFYPIEALFVIDISLVHVLGRRMPD